MLAVIRVRGYVNLDVKIREAFKHLCLDRVNYMVLIPEEATRLGQVKKTRDYITFGQIDETTLALVLETLADNLKDNWAIDYLNGYVQRDIKWWGSDLPTKDFEEMFVGMDDAEINKKWKEMKAVLPYLVTAKLIAIERILAEAVENKSMTEEIADTIEILGGVGYAN